MSFRCIICRKGPMDGVTVHRIAKGRPEWVCSKHIKQTDAPPIDPDVQRIISAIEAGAK